MLAVACSHSSGDLSPSQASSAIAQQRCAWAVQCGEVTDEQTCLDSVGSLGFFGSEPGLTDAIAAGTVQFDGAAEVECWTDLLFPANCGHTACTFASIPAACANIAVGTVPAGGACEIDEECVSQTCDVPSCTDACCPGTCVGSAPTHYAHLGETCGAPPGGGLVVECLDSTCASGTCVALAGMGSACIALYQCGPGAICDLDNSKVCIPLASAGGSCEEITDCATADLDCVMPSGSDSGTCVKVGLLGAACSDSAPCSEFYRCVNGTCGTLAGFGEACSIAADCAQQGACYQGSCVGPEPNGSSCSSSSDCAGDYCNDPQGSGNGTCATDPACH